MPALRSHRRRRAGVLPHLRAATPRSGAARAASHGRPGARASGSAASRSLTVAGAAVAIAIAWQGPSTEPVVTATGGSVTAPTPPVEPISRLAVWPRAARGWTIVLASIPKTKGRDKAVAIAQQGRTRGLPRVGVLDSSRFASLQPGYWMTFTGRFQSEAAATGSLRRARVAVKGARVRADRALSFVLRSDNDSNRVCNNGQEPLDSPRKARVALGGRDHGERRTGD